MRGGLAQVLRSEGYGVLAVCLYHKEKWMLVVGRRGPCARVRAGAAVGGVRAGHYNIIIKILLLYYYYPCARVRAGAAVGGVRAGRGLVVPGHPALRVCGALDVMLCLWCFLCYVMF